MTFTTLDEISRRALLENSKPIHYYMEYLFHSSSCVRELTFDTLKIVNTVYLPVNDYGAADLPSDYEDEVGVSFNAGDLLQPIPHINSVNPLRVHNTTTGAFEQQTIPEQQNVDNNIFFGSQAWTWFWNVNGFGEPVGRFFGAKGGTTIGYEIFVERRQIQLTGRFDGGGVVLQYISNGQSLDSATQIPTRALACIVSYINWKSSPNSFNENSPEGRSFYTQKRLLRARMNELTIVDIKNILRNSYTATLKS